MKPIIALKLILLGTLIVGIARLLSGHDILTGAALILLALLVAAKITWALISRRRRSGPDYGGYPPYAPVVIPPNRPKPPELSAANIRD